MKRPLLSLTIRPLDAWQSYWEDARRLQCRIAVVVVYYAVQSGSALCVIERDLQMCGLSGCTAAFLVCY